MRVARHEFRNAVIPSRQAMAFRAERRSPILRCPWLEIFNGMPY